MKLTLRFVLLVAALVAAVGVSAYSGLEALTRLDGALTRVVDIDVNRLLAITHVRRLFRSMVVQERDYILAHTTAERAPMDSKFEKLAKELAEQLGAYEKLMPTEDAKTIAGIRAARERWLELNQRVRAAAAHDQDQAQTLAAEHAKDPVSWEAAINGLVKISDTRLDQQVTETHRVYLAARKNLFWVSAAASLLAAVFGGLIFARIRRTMAEVVELNTNLEAQVAARTQSLAQRERALRLVLDSTGDGLFEVELDGRLSGGSSAAAVRWFGEAVAGKKLSDFMFRDDQDRAAEFAMSFDQLAEDILPWELCRDQMPRRIELGQTVLALDFRRVLEDEQFKKILVVARDVTEAVMSERAEKAARDQHNLITKLLQDKGGFAQFVKDCEALLSALSVATDFAVVLRHLHTLKGNTAIFGLISVAEFCHAMEDRLSASGGPVDASDIADLAALWRLRMQSIESFLTDIDQNRLDVDVTDHTRLMDSLMRRQDYGEIIAMVEVWGWSRTAERLTRYRAHAEDLAERLERSVNVTIEDHDLRVPRDYLEGFWASLIHVIRNAVDHGAEPSEVREAQGKSAAMNLQFITTQHQKTFCVEVRDDGAGIDREALLRCARLKQIQVDADMSLLDLVFMDGISTRAAVTETSGRGVGLAAVRESCARARGTIELVTEPTKGTTLRFLFPAPEIKVGALAANIERRWSLRAPDTMSVPAPANVNATAEAQRKSAQPGSR
jgi:HPt (histidine-containing phosphotransfer) domain-containing protein/PAS domain-containing protein